MAVVKAQDLAGIVGQEVGVSDWIEIDQERINVFADVTEDHQFIHIDEEKAKQTPFGGTIAHGFLTLSMLSALAAGTSLVIDGIQMGINYGFEKVRFLQPVRAGKKIRGRFTLAEATERKPGQWMLKYAVSVEIEGEEKPALMAEWLTLQIVG
ncbi:MaoC family dehydratase [Maricaulis alexandrii]|jgi:acyl dehydratase|uniref:MaoC family dehydratase n=1 Tax=Maricaulis alexandrii TaxID=2570354 RepID=UPI00110858F8|nr:MaoC family dehydratase [Maricaulis alexandrii]